MSGCYLSAEQFLRFHRPVDPVRCWRPFAVARAADWFGANFQGKLVYAVKANPSAYIIVTLLEHGVRRFDVASLAEIEMIRALAPQATLLYMNPVKSRAHIRAAYFDHGVRMFAVDHLDEVKKILKITDNAPDLSLFVRVACNDDGSVLPLGEKYGARGDEGPELLQFARAHAARLGVTFHVGSQALKPARYGEAIRQVAELVRGAGVVVDMLNVGGGFPIYYKAGDPVDLTPYVMSIKAALGDLPLSHNSEVFIEPGRALVAEAESLIVRVDARRGRELFINDGGYGILFDAAFSDWVFPTRLIGPKGAAQDQLAPFSLWGPTCDAADQMKGPFHLPDSVREGDYLEIHKTGAYGISMASQFNGFGTYEDIELKDEVLHSNYVTASELSSDGACDIAGAIKKIS